jgi:Na+/proline symporter
VAAYDKLSTIDNPGETKPGNVVEPSSEMLNMEAIVLTTIVVIALAVAVVASLTWRRQKGEKLEGISGNKKKAFFAQWLAGIVVALTAAILMFDGDILGENTAGISTVIGIVGIALIGTSNVHLLPLKR